MPFLDVYCSLTPTSCAYVTHQDLQSLGLPGKAANGVPNSPLCAVGSLCVEEGTVLKPWEVDTKR